MVSALSVRGSVEELPSREYVLTACGASASGPGWADEGGAAGATVLSTREGRSERRVDWAGEGVGPAGEDVGVAGEETGAG